MQHHVKLPVYLFTLAYTMSVTDNKTKKWRDFQHGRTNFQQNKGTNRVEVHQKRGGGALDRFKFEVANEIGVDLKKDITDT